MIYNKRHNAVTPFATIFLERSAGAFTADRGFFFEKMIQQYGVAAFALFPLPEGGGFFVPAKNFYRIL